MISSSLVLLLAVISCIDSYELTQPESLTVRPDATLTINCKVSYSVTNERTGWIRQPAGKAMEWIGVIYTGGGADYKDSLKSKFSITRDTSSNTITLQGKNMQAEDTAVYYCAKEDTGAYYFDYWGKGTKVTVSSDLKKKPDVFTMSQCESSSDLLVIGCLASGFSPASLDFKWKDNGKDLNDFMEYPTVQNGVKTFKVSLLNITKEKFNQNNITCEARHQEGNIITPFRKVSPQKPTLSVVPVITQKSSSVMCVVENFYPRNLTVQLKEKDGKIRKSKLEYRVNTEGLYTAYSLYKVSSETWTSNIDYICEVTHQGVLIIEKANFKAKFALTLKPPIQKELFVKGKVVLEAVVSGDTKDVVEEATVSCNGTVTPGEVKFYEDISQFIRKHNVTVDTKKWFDGEKVTCTLSDKKTNNKIQQVINFNGDGQKPTVFIYSPDSIDTDRVTHVCEVTSPKLSDVYIMWIINEKHYIEGATSAPIHQNDSMSVFSILTMTKEEYEKLSTTITCAVKHANMKDINAPLQVSTSKSEPPEPETGFALDCNKDVLEEDEFRSLWSTATSFIFLFLFSLTYSAVLSLFKVKQ